MNIRQEVHAMIKKKPLSDIAIARGLKIDLKVARTAANNLVSDGKVESYIYGGRRCYKEVRLIFAHNLKLRANPDLEF